MQDKVYGIEFGPTASAQKHMIPIERREAFDRAVFKLLLDPRQAPAHQLPDGTWRVRMTKHITMFYAISDFACLVMAIKLDDDAENGPEYLEPED